MEKENIKKIGNILFWIVMAILVLFIAYNLYNRYKPNTLQRFPQQGLENREDTGNDGQEGSAEREDGSGQNGGTGQNSNAGQGQDDDQNAEGQKPGKVMAPDFTLEDMDGNKVKLSDYRDKIVFLNFWATWCPYCIQEMSDLDKANKELEKRGDGVIIAVDIQENADTVKKFMKDKKLSLPVLMDYEGEVAGMYGVSGIPVTFVINKDGSFYGKIPGATNDKIILDIADEIK